MLDDLSIERFGATIRAVSLTFQSLRSSSSGNCLLLQSESTTLVIDCGIKTQRECRELLGPHAERISGVLVTHAHGDHICYSALKVLQGINAAVHCHDEVLPLVQHKHIRRLRSPFALRPFSGGMFSIGDFDIQPVPLPHEPHCPTFGFVIHHGACRIVICTDFYDTAAIEPHLVDADLIFIESNHDLELLRLFPNYASHFHLSNPKSAAALCRAIRKSRRAPRQVMLGHLSEQRNNDDVALQTLREAFTNAGIDMDFPVRTAPRYEASEILAIS